MKLFFCFLLLTITYTYSQQTKITVIDSLNSSELLNFMLLQENGLHIASSNGKGELFLNYRNDSLLISSKGFETKKVKLSQSKTNTFYLTKPSKLLEEVKVTTLKPTLIGNTNKSKGFPTMDWVCDINTKEQLVCVTKIIVTKETKITKYNFCIGDFDKTNPTFNFQIYNEDNNLPSQLLYNQIVATTKNGWNVISLDEKIILKPGIYYFGMQWLQANLYKPRFMGKSKDGTKNYSAGQSISMNKGDELDDIEINYTRNNNNWNKRGDINGKKYYFMQYLTVYEY